MFVKFKYLIVLFLINSSSVFSQIKVKTLPVHLDFWRSNFEGTLSANILYGTPPYTYQWSPGFSTNQNITNLSIGTYTLKVKDNHADSVSYIYSIGYKSEWYNFYGSKFRNDTLAKSTEILGNVTAVTKNTLLENENGWAEMIISDFNYPYAFGFLDSTSEWNKYSHEDMDFAFHETWGRNIYAFHSGYWYSLGTVTTGDVIRISRTDTLYELLKNNVVIFSRPVVPTKKLKIKAILDEQPLSNIGVSFVDSSEIDRLTRVLPRIKHTSINVDDSLGSASLNLKGGLGTLSFDWKHGATTQSIYDQPRKFYEVNVFDPYSEIYTSFNIGYSAVWQSLNGMIFKGDTLFAYPDSITAGTYPSAVSKNELNTLEDGWAEYVVPRISSGTIVGFCAIDKFETGEISDINTGFYIDENNYLYAVFENQFQLLDEVTEGDIIKLNRNSGESQIQIWINSDIIFQFDSDPELRLRAKAVATRKEVVANIGLSFADSTSSNSLRAIALIDHTEMHGGDRFGNIKLKISGGQSPYSVVWDPVQTNSLNVTEVARSQYSVTVTDNKDKTVHYTYNIAFKTDWSNFQGTTFRNDSLLPDTSSVTWRCAFSKNILNEEKDGFVEYVLPEFTSPYFIGFSESFGSAASFSDCVGGFKISGTDSLYSWNGSSLTYIGTAKTGDVINLQRMGFDIKINRNNQLVSTHQIESAGIVRIKASFHNTSMAYIGCSMKSEFAIAYEKIHADGNLTNGSIKIFSGDDSLPKVRWGDGIYSNPRHNLKPGKYNIYIENPQSEAVLAKNLSLGVQPDWGFRYNLKMINDSIWPDSANHIGQVVSNDVLRRNTSGWFELKPRTSSFTYGFISVPSAFLDTNYTVPVLNDSIVQLKKIYARQLYNNALTNHLNYNATNHIDMGGEYEGIYLVVSDSGFIKPLFNGAHRFANYRFTENDIVAIGRDSLGDIFISINDSVVLRTNGVSHNNEAFYSMMMTNRTIKPSGLGLVFSGSPDYERIPNCIGDLSRNWKLVRRFDEYGNVIGEAKEFYDNFGRAIQTQAKILSESNVLASEQMYDSYGRSIGKTLPAPLFKNKTCYEPLFFTNNASSHYGLNNFDKPVNNNSDGEIYNPSPVNNTTKGTLGWYYSNNNNEEYLVPHDNTPYSRTLLSNDPLNRPIKTSGVGKNHKMGSGHEVILEHSSAWLSELQKVYPKSTFILNDNFVQQHVNFKFHKVYKTITINEDGHDFITYKSDNKVLATCVSGYDPNCPAELVTNQMIEGKSLLIHVPEQYNNTLKIKDNSGGTFISNIYPMIQNYVTKEWLTSNDRTLTYNSNGEIEVTFLGGYASHELYLNLQYVLAPGSPPSPTNYQVSESHLLNYTQWNVNYYDMKGRLKATQSPDDVVCHVQPKNSYGVFGPIKPSGFSCVTTDPVTEMNARGIRTENNDTIFEGLQIIVKPEFNLFTGLKQLTAPGAFKFQSNDTLAPRDSLLPPIIVVTDSLIQFEIADTLTFNDTIQHKFNDTVPDFSNKSYTVKGNYYYTVVKKSGARVTYTDFPVPFEYEVLISHENSRILDKHPGEGSQFWLDSLQLVDFDSLYLHTDNLRIKLDGFVDAPISEFSPCDLELYIGEQSASLISNINNNIGFNLQYFVIPGSPGPPPIPSFSKQFYYNEYDHLVGEWTKDGNKVNYLYDLAEDKLMFSQNEKQRLDYGKFSYIKYDDRGRPVESGEYDIMSHADPNNYDYQFQTYHSFKASGPPSGVLSAAYQASINSPFPPTPRFTERQYTEYDVPSSNNLLATSGYPQKYTHGKVSCTKNDNGSTCYSYNERGELQFTIQDNGSLGSKTFEYENDFTGKLIKTVYQRNQSDEIAHFYNYDVDGRATSSFAYRGLGYNFIPLQDHSYYKHGALKRTVLGNIQGLDYTYTIGGRLKAVNNPIDFNVPGSYDPGFDGTGLTSMPRDFFAYALEYYPGDYERASSKLSYNKPNTAYDKFNISYTGIIHAQRWGYYLTAGIVPTPNITGPLMYEYNYDYLYRLTNAQFCNYSVGSASHSNFLGDFIVTPLGSNKLEGITYDRNGNIKTLDRYAHLSSGQVLMDQLNYNYNSTFKNRLTHVTDGNTTNYSLSSEMDFPNQSSNNYLYNSIGELTVSATDNQKYIYNSQGLVEEIRKSSNNNLIASFVYNDLGLRQSKTSYNSSGNPSIKTWYTYASDGQLLAIYEENIALGGNITLKEFALNSGGRIGTLDATYNTPFFELKDQVGNVRMVLGHTNYSPGTMSYTDYYPHGGPIPGRKYSLGTPYRFGMQGQEKDPETGLTNFELRQIDPRLGRWLSPDPYGQHNSPYLAMSNNPVNSVDPNGGWDDEFWSKVDVHKLASEYDDRSKLEADLKFYEKHGLVDAVNYLESVALYKKQMLDMREARHKVDNLMVGHIFANGGWYASFTTYGSFFYDDEGNPMTIDGVSGSFGVHFYDRDEVMAHYGLPKDGWYENGRGYAVDHFDMRTLKAYGKGLNEFADAVVVTVYGTTAVILTAGIALEAAPVIAAGYEATLAGVGTEISIQTHVIINTAYTNVSRAAITSVGSALLKHLPRAAVNTPAFQRLFEFLVKNETKNRDILKDGKKIYELYRKFNKVGNVGH